MTTDDDVATTPDDDVTFAELHDDPTSERLTYHCATLDTQPDQEGDRP